MCDCWVGKYVFRGKEELLGLGETAGLMLRDEVASTKRANSVGEVNSSTASLSRRNDGSGALAVMERCNALGAEEVENPRPAIIESL